MAKNDVLKTMKPIDKPVPEKKISIEFTEAEWKSVLFFCDFVTRANGLKYAAPAMNIANKINQAFVREKVVNSYK